MCAGGAFLGMGLETDESAPFGNKWTGYRFQITIIYLPLVKPIDEWEDPRYDEKPPCDVISLLQDICHAPTKDGKGLLAILEKQLFRQRLAFPDVVSGTTDGGGENVGKDGMHAFLESLGQGYVKRRGLEHISWRVCDAGLAAAPDLTKKYITLSRYLHDGTTWSRLQAIATLNAQLGGIGLMRPYSAEFAKYFRASPPGIIADRPETDKNFLRWLYPREDVLLKCIEHDATLRNIADMSVVLGTLRDREERLERIALAELLERGCYLHRFAMKHKHIMAASAQTTPEKLIEKATRIITSASCLESQELLAQFGSSPEDVISRGFGDEHWCKVVARLYDAEDLLLHLQEFQLKVSSRMATHLTLTFENINLSHWWSAAMLSHTPQHTFKTEILLVVCWFWWKCSN
jgi:hypothetical protein